MKRVIALLVCLVSQCVYAQFSLSYEALVRKGLPVDTVVMNEYEKMVIANDDKGAFLIIIENKEKTTFWQMSIDGSMMGVHSFDYSTAQYALGFKIAHLDSCIYQVSLSENSYNFSSQQLGVRTDYYFDNLGLLLKTIKVIEKKFDWPLTLFDRTFTTKYQSDLDADGNGVVKVFENDVFNAIYLVEKFIVVSVKMIE